MDDGWYYFGCGRESGHYLFRPSGQKEYGKRGQVSYALAHFDGCFPPYPEQETVLYQASMSRLGGLGYSALAWWDRSVDKRGASNSIIFAPSLDIEPDTMLAEAQRRFPWVFNRTPQPVTLWNPAEAMAA